jgi:hypothetical protein
MIVSAHPNRSVNSFSVAMPRAPNCATGPTCLRHRVDRSLSGILSKMPMTANHRKNEGDREEIIPIQFSSCRAIFSSSLVLFIVKIDSHILFIISRSSCVTVVRSAHFLAIDQLLTVHTFFTVVNACPSTFFLSFSSCRNSRVLFSYHARS